MFLQAWYSVSNASNADLQHDEYLCCSYLNMLEAIRHTEGATATVAEIPLGTPQYPTDPWNVCGLLRARCETPFLNGAVAPTT